MTTSIIIGFTPFHLMPMRELECLAEGDVHVFHPMAAEPGVLGMKAGVSFLGACNNPRRPRWTMYRAACRAIDKIMRSGDAVDLYLPHPFNPLTNYAFFHAASCNRFIYQDGILNYYDAATPLKTVASRMRQRAKGVVIGSRYRVYGGHLSGIDARAVSGGFFTHPGRIVGAEKFPSLRRLEFRHAATRVEALLRRGTLFLDQPIESLVEPERARELRRLTVDYVNALGGPVFYKPHYAQGHEISCDRVWMSLDPALRGLPAEWAVARMDVANVVSFCTSALANIAMSDASIGCHATAAGQIPVSVDGRPTDLSEVLSGLGVRVVDLLPR